MSGKLKTRSMHVRDPESKPIIIRKVWSHNVDQEFMFISRIITSHPFVSMDTEFPGIIFPPSKDTANTTLPHGLSPSEQYRVLKSNVDATNLIQLGLTFSDSAGHLPDFGTGYRYIWEFNFRDFDVMHDAYAPNSIELLHRQGIDFKKNRKEGIDSVHFKELMIASGLLYNYSLTWVTFHGAYDFGYLVKILTRRTLPELLRGFLNVVIFHFGARVYDVKYMMKFCDGLYGGLERVAKRLGESRGVGECHQAGSDSLLTSRAFRKMVDVYFHHCAPVRHASLLFGLEHASSIVWIRNPLFIY